MKSFRRILSIVLVALITIGIFTMLPVLVYAEVSSGQCGDNATWEYDSETKTLTVSGTGRMYDTYNLNTNLVPWNSF